MPIFFLIVQTRRSVRYVILYYFFILLYILFDTFIGTVPNDDLSDLHPEWKKGATIILKDEEVEDYLRYRDIEEDFSNAGRIARQKSYLVPFLKKISELSETDSARFCGILY